MIALLILFLLSSCTKTETVNALEELITKVDTTSFAVDTTENDTIDIDIQIDTTMTPIYFDVTVEDWEENF